ncbi:MAG: PilC/PilY family type IV pilus protein [Candidatus Binatia bacterium]|nr:PilC/PilY family type IV pilus protein [Candidatus Binatia bacterium]
MKRLSRRAVLPIVLILGWVGTAAGLDTDIFTGTQVAPNVLLIMDNSGSMGLQAYNTYPNTIYTGSFTPGTVYTRCKDKNGISGGNVHSNCRCGRTQSDWVVDQSHCAGSFTDIIPPPNGDDIDDRDSRRRMGNRRNFETNPPKNCVASLEPCTSDVDCSSVPGDSCAEQNKMAIAKGVMTSAINDAENDNVRFGMTVFDPAGIDYNSMDYSDPADITNWHVNNEAFVSPVQDMDASSRASLTSAIQAMSANGGTPTSHRLIDAWNYFNGTAGAPGFTTSPVEYVCQRNYVLMVTDGIPEVEADFFTSNQQNCTFNRLQSFAGTPGDLNGDGKEDPASPAYLATTGEMYNCGSDYLDDVMLKVRGEFPLGNSQNQPLALYAISFGFDFCQEPAPGDTSPGGGSMLWRASKKYGGGDCLSAADPDKLDDKLREAINLIKNDAQSFVAPVVPVSQTNRTESGDRLYVALFSPREGQQEWTGNIKKYGLNRDSGTVCNASSPSCTPGPGAATLGDGTILGTAESYWDGATGGASGSSVTSGGVGAVLQQSNIANRNIFTYTGGGVGALGGLDLSASGQAFDKANGSITPAMLGLVAPDDTQIERDALIDYIHGVDVYDSDDDGDITETRSWILGDIIHSVPLIVNYDPAGNNALIIVGANDGMLHAFDDATGAEVWAFVPPDVLGNLNLLRPGQASTHPFFVDASPKVFNGTSGEKTLVFGLGRGGRAYYGLDITSKTAPKLLWRVNDQTSGYSELGLTMSTPAMTKYSLAGGAPVAVVGGGYDTHFDDPAISTPNSSGAMGRTIYVIDLATGNKLAEAGGSGMDYAIPSDALVFDVNGDGVFDRGYIGDMGGNMWRIRDDFSVELLFSAPAGHRIYYAPDAVINAGSVMVYFGTGDRSSPLSTQVTDRFYGVRDDAANNLHESDFVDVTNTVVQPGSPEEETLIGQIADKHGWFIRLLGVGEKVLAPPTVFFNVAFATFTPSTVVCEAGGSARLYAMSPLTGSPSFDLAGTSGGGLGDGSGEGSGAGGILTTNDRFVLVGQSIPTSLKVTFGDDETKAFFGVTKGGGIALQPLSLPQMQNNVVPVNWREVW